MDIETKLDKRQTYYAAKYDKEMWATIVADALADKSADRPTLARYVAKYKAAKDLAATTLKDYVG